MFAVHVYVQVYISVQRSKQRALTVRHFYWLLIKTVIKYSI